MLLILHSPGRTRIIPRITRFVITDKFFGWEHGRTGILFTWKYLATYTTGWVVKGYNLTELNLQGDMMYERMVLRGLN